MKGEGVRQGGQSPRLQRVRVSRGGKGGILRISTDPDHAEGATLWVQCAICYHYTLHITSHPSIRTLTHASVAVPLVCPDVP